jgi:hypothetical protein
MDKYPTYGHRPGSANRHVDLLSAAGGASSAKRDPGSGMLGCEQLAVLLFGDEPAPGRASDTQAIARLAFSPSGSAKVLFDTALKLAQQTREREAVPAPGTPMLA